MGLAFALRPIRSLFDRPPQPAPANPHSFVEVLGCSHHKRFRTIYSLSTSNNLNFFIGRRKWVLYALIYIAPKTRGALRVPNTD
jgi:hypothetical protein